jgi:hypothetical protein
LNLQDDSQGSFSAKTVKFAIVASLNDGKETKNSDSLITIDLQAGKIKTNKNKEKAVDD